MLSIVISKLDKNQETQKIQLVKDKAKNEERLQQLDDEILYLLQEAMGSLIDDLKLIESLTEAKNTSESVANSMET